ncbi:acetyl-CoA acyltransferase/acetyl-CoA acyltransferase [Pseudomonas pohangensis]|uniref:Acetyl-CoA acyltransferase/acetyl-CoA acyltransferase n=1 Tax=Pseudomonas pohangensis TaxID=364197 RepID=A0A1H2FAU8_9PSED|nr:thiolase family protein [Pseudomonas pohangensis]SDU04464.1 acetyl-CoA acyltransferase/acetyl-CoA acyltransferase [Pseudomonas pohangensis]
MKKSSSLVADPKRLPVIVRGARTPFLDTGGKFSSLMSYELGAKAIAGVIEKSGIDGGCVDMVCMGTVVHETETSNVARECMLNAGLPSTTPAYTVSMAGLSPNVAVANLCDMILLGRIEVAVAGGTESFSDIPVRLSQTLRRSVMRLNQDSSAATVLSILKSLRPRDLLPKMPTGTDFTTRKTMGALCERMVEKYGSTRAESDAFAVRSHQLASQAWEQGNYDADIVPVHVSGQAQPVTRDNSVRADASLEKLGRLKPVFNKRSGIVTAGNSSRLTDGAAALLLTSLGAAERMQLTPLAAVRDYVLAGTADLNDEMLLGPAMAIPRLLRRNGLSVDDIDVWELHEAFAAQILVNQVCLGSADFAKQRHAMEQAVGAIPLEKLNTWGGSLALGNPFSATGVRLLTTAAHRLQQGNGRYAIISSCAGGGLGAAILLERMTG